ncbi:MAG TPA: methylenetetrahydrofolate reductase [Acidimicrobiales bacterium]|nr:methylenetetrahydrofolate reductase [Acidimicrobiales bacterium]
MSAAVVGARPVRGRLATAVAEGRFAVTAELTPPKGADTAALRRAAALLAPHVHAVNLTDNAGAVVRLASWAAAVAVAEEGVEPVVQLQCRDRNRLALQSDLLGAAALGIPNVLLLTGDHQSAGDEPGAAGVFDLDALTLIETAARLRDEGRLGSGAALSSPPRWLIGAVENPAAPPLAFRPERAARKVAAGAQFLQTQFVFDVPLFAEFLGRLGDLGALERCAVLAGVGPVRSRRMLERLRHGIPGVVVPPSFAARFDGVPDARFAEAGIAYCAETVAALRSLPGIGGIHLMAFSWEEAIVEVLERVGLAAREPEAVAQ